MPESAVRTCPYCNATLPALTVGPTGPRTPCPRCAEPVPSEQFAIMAGHSPPAYAGGSLVGGSPTPSQAAGKKRTLRILLAIMAGMATLTLVFALLTQHIRRKHDFRDRPDGATELARKPAELVGLAYLPQGTILALGIHVAALNDDPTGQALLQGPRAQQETHHDA